MSTTKYSYVGFMYRQGQSEQGLISFCAPAEQIKQWGGVPAKTTRFHGGFQRALSRRYRKIMKFFEAGDVSPTSIIVAFRESQLKLTPLGYPDAWSPSSSLSYPPSLVHICFDAIDTDPAEADTFQLAKAVAESVAVRLNTTENPTDEESDASEASEDNLAESSAEDEDEDDNDDLDIGISKLREFYQFVSSPEAITKWVTEETARFDALKKDGKVTADELPPEMSLRTLLLSLLKPAMIVDGQHRVTGAANASVTEDIVFSVCALKDADWVEQVFQFVVLNKLAKPISKDFLTGLLNTSLTNNEIAEIEPQLERVGISNADRVIMRTINFEPESPFFDMVAQPGEVVGAQHIGRLSGQGMLRIAKRWRIIGTASKKTLKELRMFEKLLKGTSNTARCQEWLGGKTVDPETNELRRGKWATFFHSFWRTIKAIYEPLQVWEKGPNFNLLMIVTMYELQDYFIETKAAADSKFASQVDFEEQVRTFFADIPATFFQNWEATGLQSGDGPATIRHALKMFKEQGLSLKEVKTESVLFNAAKKRSE